jgi:hypothetical protein
VFLLFETAIIMISDNDYDVDYDRRLAIRTRRETNADQFAEGGAS